MRRSEGSPWCIPCETRASPQLCVVIENSDIEMADASDRIKEHRERQQRLETAAEEARSLLAERRVMLDNATKIAAFASEMSEFLQTSEITETRAFVRSFVKAILVKPGRTTIHYTIPTPPDSPIGARTPPRSLSRREL